jgi:hypothetical protein
MKALTLVGIAFTLLLPIAIAVAEPAAKDHAQSQTAGALVQTNDIPESVQTAIKNGSLGEKYEVSFHLSPFYLRGDFNGDGKIDVAALVKQRSTGKLGIAIVDGEAEKATILALELPSVMVVMISSGWIRGRFIPKTVWRSKAVKKASHICAETRFS